LQHGGQRGHFVRGVLRAAAARSSDFCSPRSFAALRSALSSSLGARTGSGGCATTGPDLPQTSMAHCTDAGPGRPVAMDRMASATSRGASPGLRMRAE
jgi:hypothetical protein